jgi:hypothetical protein
MTKNAAPVTFLERWRGELIADLSRRKTSGLCWTFIDWEGVREILRRELDWRSAP